MSISAQISITKDDATPEVAHLMESTRPERLAQICRDPLRGFWRDRLKKYPRLPGKFAAFPSTGFGEEAADSVEGFAGNGTVTLTANKIGLRAQYEGAVIRPVNAKVLCFGVTPESYGKSYAEMRAELTTRKVATHEFRTVTAKDAKSQDGKSRNLVVGAQASFAVKRKRTPDEAAALLRKQFAFARQVTLRPNPQLVPTNDEFQEVAMEAIMRSLAAGPVAGGSN